MWIDIPFLIYSERNCFNRYMVECESVCCKREIRQCYILIDTWWNVNTFSSGSGSSAGAVLIDTWWNVNSAHSFTFARHKCVLIDTWWNVNTFTNTYKVTCNLVLIDTWWNVNVLSKRRGLLTYHSFNRYMVECEWTRKTKKSSQSESFNRYMVECE